MNNTICFVPVRKGSKGIPHKNIRLLGDKPLICWVLDAALASGIADAVWVATDCDNMQAMITERYGNRVHTFRRSEWTARDDSPTMDVINEFLSFSLPDDTDRFILLQATSPFTLVCELRTLHDEMLKGEYDSFIACCRMKKFRWSEDGQPLDYMPQAKPMRQDYEGMLVESGAFYATTIGQMRQTGLLISGKVKVMEIGKGGMIDIDEEEDWSMAEGYLKHFSPITQPTLDKETVKEFLSSLEGRLVFYIYDNLQLEAILPLINLQNRPVLLITEPEADAEVEVNDNVTAIEKCFSFEFLLDALKPEGVVAWESTCDKGQTILDVAKGRGLPSVAIRQSHIDEITNVSDTINRNIVCHYLKTSLFPCLHIGCGSFLLDGWLNTDLHCYNRDIYYLDAGKPYPFPDHSFHYIYSEHLFEHLTLEQGTNMLNECFRILKPAGKMRLAMPDFHFLMDLYQHPQKDINRQYLEWSFRQFLAKRVSLLSREDLPVHVINNFFHAWGHQFIHTPEELIRMAKRAGFRDVCICKVGESETPIFQSIEKHGSSIPDWANRLETFVVEIEK